MFDRQRLHPATIILNTLRFIKDSFFLIILIILAGNMLYTILILVFYILLGVGTGILSWYRYTYWVEEDALHMEYGIFRRTKRTISKNRIQSIDLTENIVHRLFKLVRVQIETASTGTQAEASLPAVKFEVGEALRDNLKYKKLPEENEISEMEVSKEELKREITFKQLLLAGVTSGGIGIILSFVVIGLLEVEEFIPENVYDVTFEWLISTSILTIVVLVMFVLIFVWILSVGWTLIRYGKFTIKLADDELLITRGLLERKQLTIPLHRIQAVGIEENLLRQPFGYASIVAEIAGGSSDKQTDASVLLFPIMHRSEIPAFLDKFAPAYSWEPENVDWIKPPKQAIKYYIFRSGILFFILSLAVFYLLPAYTWVAILLLGLTLYRGLLSYQDTGFQVNENRLLLRYRVLKRITVILYPKRIQAFEKKQHPLQRRDHVTTMKLSIISSAGGKHYRIKELVEENVDHLSERYFEKNKKHRNQIQ